MSIYPADLLTALHQLPSLTPKNFSVLLQSGLLQQPISRWSIDSLRSAGIDQDRQADILHEISSLDLTAAREALAKLAIQVVTLLDPEYPSLLKEIPAPPPLLYVRGRIAALSATLLGVVGTRQPTPYGKTATEILIRPVTRAGIGIVSGLALGIDGLAHTIALTECVPTVAVLGCGVDRIYPWQHQDLAEQIIAAGGAVISEFPIGAAPKREHFPQRNRIISGLSRATVIVEAGEKSGALITAKYAIDQNREVLAVPGPITSPQSIGPIHWIQLGAKAIHSANDILEVFSISSAKTEPIDSVTMPTDPTQAHIFNQLTHELQHVDVLAASCRLEASVVSAALVLLELDGRVAHHGGMYYSLTS